MQSSLRRSLGLACGVLAVILLLGSPLRGQAPSAYPPFTPTAEYDEAFRLAELGQFDKAADAFMQVAAANPGSTMGANAMFEAAYYARDPSRSESIYRSIITQYPQSRFAVSAGLALVNLQYRYRDIPARVAATDQLAQSYGGPALRDILKGPNPRLAGQIRALPLEIQVGLITPYFELHGLLANRQGRYQDALALAFFEREAFGFDDYGSAFSMGDMLMDLRLLKNVGAFQAIRTNPIVRIKSPKPGHSTGPRPRIRIKMFTGDYQHPQVDTGKLQLLLDGQDIKPYARIRSKVNTSMKIGKTFERLLLTVRPPAPLAKGTHILSITVPTEGYQGSGPGITVANVTFNVGKSKDDKDDECADDDDWNWGGWHDDDDDENEDKKR